ncbi:MAG: putative sugar nucleotidyl transferase [Pirellulales bacterium]
MIVLFEDAFVDRLAPLNYGKPTYALSCAAERLVDLARRSNLGEIRALVRPHLRALEAADYPDVCLHPQDTRGTFTLINARLVPRRRRWNGSARC